MEVYQVDIFGKYQKVITKDSKEYKPKKLNKKNRILKEKLKILYGLYEELYKKQEISILEYREVIMKDNLIIYPEDRQAEPKKIINLNVLDDIDKRIEETQKEIEKYEQLEFDFMKDYK